MKLFNKYLVVILILLLGVGFVSASDDITSNNDTAVLAVEDMDVAGVGNNDDVVGVVNSDNINSTDALDHVDGNVEDTEKSGNNNVELLGDSSSGGDYEVITSNVTLYDFGDVYKVKVVDVSGSSVVLGYVDFFVNHKLVSTSLVGFSGITSFKLGSYINSSGSYDIVSVFHDLNDNSTAVAHQRINVDNVLLSDRDIQVIFEGKKLYDLGEKYSVRVVDINGNPVRKGQVYFVFYDRILSSNLSDTGFASCVIPRDLNFSGNLLVLTWYSDGDLYDLSVCEQISIGTRTLVSLDKNSLGSRFDSTWKRYDYVYNNGQYVASLGNNVYHVIELSGKSYLLYDVNVTSSAELAYNLALFSRVNPYDVVRLIW